MYTIEITGLQYDEAIDQTNVAFVLKGKEENDIEKRVLGFAGRPEVPAIKKELKKYLDTVNSDLKASKEERKLDAERLQNKKKIDTMNEELKKEVIK